MTILGPIGDPNQHIEPEQGTLAPNRETRRRNEKNGMELPIIQLMLFPSGRVKLDTVDGINSAQVKGFLLQMLDKLPAEEVDGG